MNRLRDMSRTRGGKRAGRATYPSRLVRPARKPYPHVLLGRSADGRIRNAGSGGPTAALRLGDAQPNQAVMNGVASDNAHQRRTWILRGEGVVSR